MMGGEFGEYGIDLGMGGFVVEKLKNDRDLYVCKYKIG